MWTKSLECGIPNSAYWGRKTLCCGTIWNLKRRRELERLVFHPANWPKNGWLRSLSPFSEQNNLTRYKWNFYLTNVGTVLEDSYLHFALCWDQTSWREKNRELCGIKRQKSARPFPSFSALALLLALPLLHWVAWSKANAASAATSLQGSSSQCSLSVWKREEMKLWERREKNSFLDWVDRGFVCMETMNVTAWYCCILRTKGVDLKIVNLFIAISIGQGCTIY